jgi:hypothetical protein
MSLLLPDFKGRKCVEIDLCGHIAPSESKEIQAPPQIKKHLVARYSGAEQDAYLSLVLPFPAGKKMHVHLRIAAAERFGGAPPEVNSTTEEIFRLLEPFYGKKIDVELDGNFRVTQAELRPSIRSAAVETFSDDVQVRMIGATIAVRGAPIHTISWRLSEKGDRANIVLEARTKLTLDESYINKGFDLLEAAFRAFVFRESRNG